MQYTLHTAEPHISILIHPDPHIDSFSRKDVTFHDVVCHDVVFHEVYFQLLYVDL